MAQALPAVVRQDLRRSIAFHERALARLTAAGIDPREHSSGSSVHKKTRISKAGNRHLRRALYMLALVAVRHDLALRAFHRHLLDNGKAKLQALVAVMRKLLHAIFGMWKHRQHYHGSKIYRLQPQLPQPLLCTTEGA